MAEFTSGNFIGQRAIYRELVKTNDQHYFAFPSLANTTQPKLRNGHLWAYTTNAVVTLANLQTGTRLYIAKTNAGVPVTYHSALSYLPAQHPGKSSGLPVLTIADDNVLSNYHAIFIPKAVKYCAGLLDYYFRGTFDVAKATGSGGMASVQIHNTSGLDFTNGTFHLFYDNVGGTRTELTNSDFSITSSSMAPDDVIYANFNTNASAVRYILAYQGTIGAASGSALDPVDDGIAIAVNSFTNDLSSLPGPLFDFSDVAWDAPTADTGLSYSVGGNSFTVNGSGSLGWTLSDTGNVTYAGPGGTLDAHIVITSSSRDTSGLSITDVTHGTDGGTFFFGSEPVSVYDLSINIPSTSGTHYQFVLTSSATGGSPQSLHATVTIKPQ